jgi:mRNA interferase RelE/StbE
MWQIEFTKKAGKQFSKLDNQTKAEISKFLDKIIEANNPFISGKMLVGEFSGFWRYRVGKYRIICEIQNNKLVIEVISIAKRDKIYN